MQDFFLGEGKVGVWAIFVDVFLACQKLGIKGPILREIQKLKLPYFTPGKLV